MLFKSDSGDITEIWISERPRKVKQCLVLQMSTSSNSVSVSSQRSRVPFPVWTVDSVFRWSGVTAACIRPQDTDVRQVSHTPDVLLTKISQNNGLESLWYINLNHSVRSLLHSTELKQMSEKQFIIFVPFKIEWILFNELLILWRSLHLLVLQNSNMYLIKCLIIESDLLPNHML